MCLHLKLLDIDHPLTFEVSKLRQIETHALIYLSTESHNHFTTSLNFETDLFSLYVLFSQWKSQGNLQEAKEVNCLPWRERHANADALSRRPCDRPWGPLEDKGTCRVCYTYQRRRWPDRERANVSSENKAYVFTGVSRKPTVSRPWPEETVCYWSPTMVRDFWY